MVYVRIIVIFLNFISGHLRHCDIVVQKQSFGYILHAPILFLPSFIIFEIKFFFGIYVKSHICFIIVTIKINDAINNSLLRYGIDR